MTDELLTTAEVARMLRVNRATVTRYARLGQLPAIRLPSGVYRFRRADVERLLNDDGGGQPAGQPPRR